MRINQHNKRLLRLFLLIQIMKQVKCGYMACIAKEVKPVENEKEILAKLQGLEEQVDILTRLVIALILSSTMKRSTERCTVLMVQIEKILYEEREPINLARLLDELN